MRREAGFTLIELMIGMLVGLIVLSAVVYTFITTLRSSKDIANSARLNREVSLVVDLLTGELRRTGYYPVQLVLAGSDYGYGAGQADIYVSNDNSCVLLSYYDDSVSSVAQRGFRFDSGALKYGTVGSLVSSACGSLNAPLHDPSVTAFSGSFDLVCTDVSTQSVVSDAQCMSGTVTETYSRAVSLAVNASIVGDVWSSVLSEYVKLPNDISP